MSQSPEETRILEEAAAEAESAPTADERAKRLARYEELCKKTSVRMQREDLDLFSQFSTVIGAVSEAENKLRQVFEKYPERVSERQQKTCTNNMKETVMVMLNEFHQLRNGRSQKKYDKRNVCVKCHNVFMEPLPKDGICDECRAAGNRSQSGGAY